MAQKEEPKDPVSRSDSNESLEKTPGGGLKKRASLLFTQDNVITDVIQKEAVDYEAPLTRRETEQLIDSIVKRNLADSAKPIDKQLL